jgi:hypothetical protein
LKVNSYRPWPARNLYVLNSIIRLRRRCQPKDIGKDSPKVNGLCPALFESLELLHDLVKILRLSTFYYRL